MTGGETLIVGMVLVLLADQPAEHHPGASLIMGVLGVAIALVGLVVIVAGAVG